MTAVNKIGKVTSKSGLMSTGELHTTCSFYPQCRCDLCILDLPLTIKRKLNNLYIFYLYTFDHTDTADFVHSTSVVIIIISSILLVFLVIVIAVVSFSVIPLKNQGVVSQC